MNSWLLNIGVVLVFSIFLTHIVITKILLIAHRKKLFDEPDERKIHVGLVPRLGGFAFIPVILISFFLLVGINFTLENQTFISFFTEVVEQLSYIFCSAILMYLTGVVDDLIGVRYRGKFAVQLMCALMFIIGGIYFDNLFGFIGFYTLPLWVAYSFTAIVVVFIINAINLIDGIDGLASGLCILTFLFYGITFHLTNQPIYSFVSFSIVGVLITFFCFNVFGKSDKQTKVFMGDAGSLTMGVLISALSIKLVQSLPDPGESFSNPLVLVYSPLIIPCFDVIRVYLGRMKRRQNPFLPDRTHIHHKLLALGLTQHQALLALISASLVYTLCNILLSPYIQITFLLLIDGLIWVLANLWLTKVIKKKESAIQTSKKLNRLKIKYYHCKYENNTSVEL